MYKNFSLSVIFLFFVFVVVGLLIHRSAENFETQNLYNPDSLNIPETITNIKYLKIADQNIKVDLAIAPEVRNQGLSGRTTLAMDEGMLFVFDTTGKFPFWMKDMNFPIDIIWIGEDMKVVYIKKNALPELFPETYGPGNNDKEAKYVLEVISGFADKNNLKIGDVVQLQN